MSDSADILPSVGVFWRLEDGCGGHRLLTSSVPITEAVSYGDCLTFPTSHYDIWEGWREMAESQRAHARILETVTWREYDEVPRGRVVYHCPDSTFWLYADRRLQGSETVVEVRSRFGLKDCRVQIRSDAHYR